MEPHHLIEELQRCKEDTVIFKKLINFATPRNRLDDESLKEWRSIFAYIIEILIPNAEVNRERMLLASHTFFALLSMQPGLAFLRETLESFLSLNSTRLSFLNKAYDISDLELFRLTCVYGYLQVNRKELYGHNDCLIIFDVLQKNCIRYTRHSYFAYKILDTWLRRTMTTDFWMVCDSSVEEKLETIIFSNWSNAISEISKRNSVYIFNSYLQIMREKYDGFLGSLFARCVENISWQNETKYVILTEICKVWDNLKSMTSYNFLLPLSASLTKYRLTHPGTKVYIVILNKLTEDQWKESFGRLMKFLFSYWETTEHADQNALRALCKFWLEPTIKMHKNILLFLWELVDSTAGLFVKSRLQRMASEMRIDLPNTADVNCYINHKDEIIRLNGFAISCRQIGGSLDVEKSEHFVAIKRFLWYNANCTTVRVREDIVKCSKVLLANCFKMHETKPDCVEEFFHWLHEFLLDCFEIGSCYQRKVLGLNLYRAMLDLPKFVENNDCIISVQKYLQSTGDWKYTDKPSLFVLLRLVLDSALDVNQLATSIILDHFDKNILSDSEKLVLYKVAFKNCNSSKFYKTESGAALLTILASWLPVNTVQNFKDCSRYSDVLFNEAASQLTEMKEDILKAIVQDKPFYGVLMALLNVAFQKGPEREFLTPLFVEKLLHLLKNAVDFFLSVLSSKSANTEYSSSFAEMGLAIDEAIKTSKVDDANYDELSLTPAHQVLMSCIWMSLKVSCELACEIGALMYSEESVKSSANIIVTVLIRCRHKGVVETAGTSIGNLTRFLCKEKKYCELPKTYIVNILKTDSMNSLNVTRRGAGLSIMLHKIIVSDNRRDRPLLHFAVEILLDLLDEFLETVSEQVESQHDSPCARCLHYLRFLVADKEIHPQLLCYMERISLTCFRYLESERWTVRNASLQLFGAIVPRLVGQSYGEASLDFGTGYSINHFIRHYPVLADYVMKELRSFSSEFKNFSTALHLHSKIIPVLILLSKFSSSGCDLIDHSSQPFVTEAKSLSETLFDDRIFNVRHLAAKAYAALTECSEIESEIQRLKRDVSLKHNANVIHGYLLAIKYLKERLSIEMENANLYSNAKQKAGNEPALCSGLERFRRVVKIWKDIADGKSVRRPCYMIETLFLQLSQSASDRTFFDDIYPFSESMSVWSSEKVQPGFFQFVDLSTRLYADYVKSTNDINIDILQKILDFRCVDQSTAFINHLAPCATVLPAVLDRLLSGRGDFSRVLSGAMIDFVLNTLKRSSWSDIAELRLEKFVGGLSVKVEKYSSQSKLWRLKVVLVALFSKDQALLSKILDYVLDISVHEEEHVRRMAIEFIQFLVRRFDELGNANKLILLHCCLILLKDEISDVREEIAENLRVHVLPKTTGRENTLGHDEMIYQQLLSELFEQSRFLVTDKERNLNFVKLFTDSIKNLDVNATIENPFYHDDNPFYREESKFLNICFCYIKENSKCAVSKNSSTIDNSKSKNENVTTDTLQKIQAKYQLQRTAGFDCADLEVVLNVKYVDYLSRKLIVVIEEYEKS